MFRKKLSILTLVILAALVLTASVAYYASANHQTQEIKTLPITSPAATTSSPIATSTLTTGPSFGALGNIGITSPTNTTYSSKTLTLKITGQVITGSNVELLATYTLDGQATLPIAIQTQPSGSGNLVVIVNGSVTLTELSAGSHYITVFADLEANGSHLAQTTSTSR